MKMDTNYIEQMKKNKAFFDAFIDLKLTGWNTFSASLDEYTDGKFKKQLDEANVAVENLAKTMKLSMKGLDK